MPAFAVYCIYYAKGICTVKFRWIALLLALACLTSLLGGCAADPVEIMRYGESSVSVNMYRYWLASYKGSFMYTYSDMTDSAVFWDTVLYDDVTAEEYLNEVVIGNVKRTLVCMELFRQNGMTLPASVEDEIDAYIDELIDERAGGSEKVFNEELANLGINVRMLRDIYRYEEQTSRLIDALYGSGGSRELSAKDIDTYCRENYVRICHIYVNDAYTYDTDEQGYYKYNEDGTVKFRELNETESAAKADTIAKIDADLASGKDFLQVYQSYSEDTFYKNGYYLTRETNFIPEVVEASFGLQVGESVKITSDYGTHWILRLEMDEKPYENEENIDFFSSIEADAENADFRAYLDTLLPDVKINREELDKYSIREAPINYSI